MKDDSNVIQKVVLRLSKKLVGIESEYGEMLCVKAFEELVQAGCKLSEKQFYEQVFIARNELQIEDRRMSLESDNQISEKLRDDNKKEINELKTQNTDLEKTNDQLGLELKSLNDEISKLISETKKSRNSIGAVLIAVFFSVGLACLLAILAVKFGEASIALEGGEVNSSTIKPSLNIVYNIADMIEAILVGTGALIASITYMVSTRSKIKSDRVESEL